MSKHIHADLIHAWAEGAQIEFYNEFEELWEVIDSPSWNVDSKYRIKQKKPKPKKIRYALYVYETSDGHYRVGVWHDTNEVSGIRANDDYYLDGEKGKLVEWIHPNAFEEVEVYINE
jgi:hypothetical protein